MSSYGNDEQRPFKRQRLSPTSSETNGHRATQVTSEQVESHHVAIDPREIQVGIAEFVSQNVIPFNAVYKKRYTDFLVNEVLPGGEVVHLTDTSVSKTPHSSAPSKTKSNTENEDHTEDSKKTSIEAETVSTTDATAAASKDSAHDESPTLLAGQITDADRSQLVSYLNENAVVELMELYKTILQHPTRKAKDHGMVRTVFTNDRSLRAEIHGALRRIFSSKIESSTDKEGFLCLTAAKQNTAKPARVNQDDRSSYYPGKLGWLERGGDYLHFTLCKENKDTMEVISFLVRQMKMSSKAFQFAGTKDRRAVTSQRVSAYRLDAERLAKQNYHLRNAAIGNFEYQRSGLELGDLGGNEFVLTLRDCEFAGMSGLDTDDKVREVKSALDLALTDLYSKGFLNYYGLQRFGTFSTGTDAVGLHILKNDFRKACEAILHFEPEVLAAAGAETESEMSSTANPKVHTGPGRDEIARAKAIDLFKKTSNAHKPLEILPRKFSAENQIIRNLARRPTDYIGCLLAIPRNLRLMYVHAYQSLVWNKAATARWQLFGGTVVEGDLVLVQEHKDKESVAQTSIEAETTSGAADIDADGEIIIAPSSHDRSNTVDDVFERARALTAAEATSGQYSIFDIVMPLPGYDILYPANKSGQYYKEFMASEEGGGLDPYDMRRKQRDFSLSGGYRKLLARIGQTFDVSVHAYSRDEEQFVQTDLERAGHGKARNANGGQDRKQDGDVEMVDEEKGDDAAQPVEENMTEKAEEKGEDVKDKVAAVLKFQLGTSQYATMALRELSRGGIMAYKA